MDPAFRPLAVAVETLVPESRREAMLRAVHTAFAGARSLTLERLPGGASAAQVYRLGVDGRDYLLRLEGPPAPLRDPARHYACLAIAAGAGVAPPLIHASAEDGIAITAFIHAVPQPGGLSRAEQLQALARTVRTLHQVSAFPGRVHYLEVIDVLAGQIRASGILPEAATADHWRCHAELAAAYACPERDYVSSHNDLNPSNVLFAGGRPWIVDWESAQQADRYVDLAALANFWSRNEAEDELILRGYFGAVPDARQRARFFLVRQANRLFYAMALLGSVLAQRPQARLTADDLETPRFEQARGELTTLATLEGRQRFGCIFLNEMRHALSSPRFAEAAVMLS